MESGNGTQYAVGDSVTLSVNTIFYAVWLPSTLTVFAKTGAETGPTVNNTSYVTLSGRFADTINGVGSCVANVWYREGGDNPSGTVIIKPLAPYTKATVTLKCYINNGEGGSANISGSFGSAKRYIDEWGNGDYSDFTASATGSSLTHCLQCVYNFCLKFLSREE